MTLPMASLVPHAGAMVLLDRVLRHDGASIVCAATSHRDPANPLRRGSLLPAVCGVEYALQAMAAHGALIAGGEAPAAGYLASLRAVALQVERLDDIPGELTVEAHALSGGPGGFVYDFDVAGDGRRLLSGRAAIILPAAQEHEPPLARPPHTPGPS